jgi:hypothetical protein
MLIVGTTRLASMYVSPDQTPLNFTVMRCAISTTPSQTPRAYIDCVRCTTYFSKDSVAPDKKAKCSSTETQLLFTFGTPEYSGLQHCIITANSPDIWGCAIISLPQIYSVTW